jgi:glyoxylase-like metal-dependent hydrolase (beta-lactamase superfamily II)
MGGVGQLRGRFRGLRVAKMIHKDSGLPEPMDDLRDGQKVEGEGVTLMPIHTPGHASDHLCYYLVEEKAVFTGDVILGGSTTVIPSEDGDLGDYLASLRRLQRLDVGRIYPAHGPVIEDAPAKIQEYIDHRMLRERQILAALGDGLTTIPAMVERIYAEVPKALHAMAAMSVESHLKKLKREGRVSETIVKDAPSRWELA